MIKVESFFNHYGRHGGIIPGITSTIKDHVEWRTRDSEGKDKYDKLYWALHYDRNISNYPPDQVDYNKYKLYSQMSRSVPVINGTAEVHLSQKYINERGETNKDW